MDKNGKFGVCARSWKRGWKWAFAGSAVLTDVCIMHVIMTIRKRWRKFPARTEAEKPYSIRGLDRQKLNRTTQTEMPGWYKSGDYQRPDFEPGWTYRGRGFRPDEWREKRCGRILGSPKISGIYDSYQEDNSVFRGHNQLPMTPEAVVKPNYVACFPKPLSLPRSQRQKISRILW